MRKFKTTAIVLSVVLASFGMTGCGEAAPAPVEENVDMDDPNEGLGDLIEEEPEIEEEEAVMNVLAIKGPSYTGLSNLKNENNEDGSYFYEDMTEDGITIITNMCARNLQRDGQDPDAYAENFVCALIDNDAKITETKGDEKLSSSLTYPAYRIYWESGSNEDSRQAVGVVVLTDNFTYYYGYKCSVDYFEDNAEFYEDELDGIKLLDLSDMGANLEDETGGSAEGAGDKEYAGLYLDKINELKSEGLADQFALEYIDQDEIPELIASDSEGSFDHENAFIFTVYNGEAVQLAAVIAGVDGGSLDFSKKNNLIHVSGAAAGMRDVFYEIKDGNLTEVFSAEASSMDEDAKYSADGKDVKEEEYYEQINGFVKAYNPLTRIDYDGLYEINYKHEDGYGYFELGSADKYSSLDEITKELQ